MVLKFLKLGLLLQIRVLGFAGSPEKSEGFRVFGIGFKLALFGFVPFWVFVLKAL